MSKSETAWSTPWSSPTRAPARPRSSAALASDAGVASPDRDRWTSDRPVEKPTAPASSASRSRPRISAMSASVATSPAIPRAPITKTRSASCGTWAAKSMLCGSASMASIYSGKLVHPQRSPSASAEPGMSSTPSISAMSASRSAGRQGAKPTPQLPITAVVTPCSDEGIMSGSQEICPS